VEGEKILVIMAIRNLGPSAEPALGHYLRVGPAAQVLRPVFSVDG
jgi:hypothetical protein